MRHQSGEYLIADTPRRTADDNILLSLSLTMSHNPNSDDHFHYGCFPRTRARSPAITGGNTTHATNSARTGRGFFNLGHAPDQSFSTHHFSQQDAQNRGDYNVTSYGQSEGWPINTTQGPNHTPFPSDPRYPVQQQAFGSYPNRTGPSIPTDPNDSHILPPLTTQPMYPGPSMASPSHIRSPSNTYPTSYQHSGQYQAHQANPYGFASQDPRTLGQPMASNLYDASSLGPNIARRSSIVDRTSRMSVHAPSPYARGPPSMQSSYSPEPTNEPTIKKKRKRADAEQLKVLNDTYARTAFPSTEERIELAKKLGMSARSVQIWFQNKRQSMRQSNRQSSTHLPPTTTEPFVATAQSSTIIPPGGGYHGSSNPVPSISMAGQGYSQRQADPYTRVGPSPTPSHPRARSREDDRGSRRSPSGRPY